MLDGPCDGAMNIAMDFTMDFAMEFTMDFAKDVRLQSALLLIPRGHVFSCLWRASYRPESSA